MRNPFRSTLRRTVPCYPSPHRALLLKSCAPAVMLKLRPIQQSARRRVSKAHWTEWWNTPCSRHPSRRLRCRRRSLPPFCNTCSADDDSGDDGHKPDGWLFSESSTASVRAATVAVQTSAASSSAGANSTKMTLRRMLPRSISDGSLSQLVKHDGLQVHPEADERWIQRADDRAEGQHERQPEGEHRPHMPNRHYR